MGKYDSFIHEMAVPFRPSLGNVEFDMLSYDRHQDPNCWFRIEVIQCTTVGSGSGFGTEMVDAQTGEKLGQWPHAHATDEIYMLIGTDPDNVFDLGGTFEIWIGEGEDAEKYLIDKPTVIHIPAGVVHMPWVIREVHRPFIKIAMPFGPLMNDAYKAVGKLPPEIEEPDWVADYEKIMK